jgi:hypothetical protein
MASASFGQPILDAWLARLVQETGPTAAAARTYASPNGHPSVPAAGVDVMGEDYYDRALALTQAHLLTGSGDALSGALHLARLWRDAYGNDLDLNAKVLKGEWWTPGKDNIPPPRGFSTLGLAVLAHQGDAKARQVVINHAGHGADMLRYERQSGFVSGRETAYSLMALLAAHTLGVTTVQTPIDGLVNVDAYLRSAVDWLLAARTAHGGQAWLSTNPDMMAAGPFLMTYMIGLLMESLALYDEIIGDSRIVPALEAATQWLWLHQFHPPTNGFKYTTTNWTNGSTLSLTTEVFQGLNGMLVPGWAWCYRKSGNPLYRDQALRIVQGITTARDALPAKAYAQAYRAARYVPMLAK